jgi:hypothetical protein
MDPASTVAVVTSRLRRLVTRDEPWLAGLRSVLRKIVTDGSHIVVGHATAGAGFVLRGATRLGIPARTILPQHEAPPGGDDLPVSDRRVMAEADVVYVLGIRPGGNQHRLLRGRLRSSSGPVILVDLPGLRPDSVTADLCDAGALMWQPGLDQCRPFDRPAHSSGYVATGGEDLPDVHLIVPGPQRDDWTLLSHTTRSCPGPWPDESFDQYADSLWESHRDADHSPLGTLRRIVTQKRLIASAAMNRGGHAVVSFTSCPLETLPALHQFRPHRVRWDFEPFGIALSREWLLKRGVRPVYYGDEQGWQSLAEPDRPFFQLARGESGIDWTVEREWRHRGDLDLEGLTADEVLLFVPDFAAAKSLREVTDWPITLWPGSDVSPR